MKQQNQWMVKKALHSMERAVEAAAQAEGDQLKTMCAIGFGKASAYYSLSFLTDLQFDYYRKFFGF